jgi:hypothetical protein
MLVNVVDSKREGAISSILVHHVFVPVCHASMERREESEGREKANSLMEVSSRTIHDCRPPHNPDYLLTLDQFLSKLLLKRYPMIILDLTPEVNINSVRSGMLLFMKLTQQMANPVILEGTITSNDRDVVGDVNQRTQGTEFYGTSSNYVLLNQLFSHARQHSVPGPTSTPGRLIQSATTLGQSGHSPAGRMSLVNLLANEDDLLAPSRDKSPVQASSSASQPSALRTIPNGLHSSDCASSGASPALKLRVAERRLERVLIRSYMHNLHHLHPMIDTDTLNRMCDEHLAQSNNRHDKHSHPRHFYALYSIVIAVGALVAGSDVTDEFDHEIRAVLQGKKHSQDPGKAPLQGLSRLYFRKSRSLLGDVFEACSLESAQTLLLMVSLLSSQIYPRLTSHSLCTVRTR